MINLQSFKTDAFPLPWITKVSPVVAHISWTNFNGQQEFCIMSLINGFYIEYSVFLTQDMSRVILCTWRCFLPKHSPPDHLQRNICPWTFKHSNKYILENHIWLPELLEQVEFELASICWLEQMSVKVEQVLFQKTRPCDRCAMTSVMIAKTEGTFFLVPPAEYR